MPWTAKKDPELCSVSEPWAVVKLDDGDVVGCHATQQDAQEQVAALYAMEGGHPDEYGSSDPPRRAGMTDVNPAGVTVNVTTNYPTQLDVTRAWNRANSISYTVGRSAETPAGEDDEEQDEVETEEVSEGGDAPQEVAGGEVEDPSDPEGEVEQSEESDPGKDEEESEDEDVEENPEEVELQGDEQAARARIHHVPSTSRPVTRQATNDHRGLPPLVLERLRDLKVDVGVIDRVGRGASEFRFQPELRFNVDGTVFVHGYATVYDFPYDVAGGPPYGWSETIVRDACRVSVAQGADVRLLINHEGIPLARTRSGTLKLENDEIGLYSAAPSLDPRSPTVQSLISAMSRRDLDEMSFAFRVKEQEWNEDFTERHITEVILFDVSMVTYPANPATVSSPRRDAQPVSLQEAMLNLRQVQVRGDRLRTDR